MHTAKSLKAEHKTLVAAKSAHKLKVKSWQALADKLNTPTIESLQQKIKELEAQLATSQGFDPVGFWLLSGNFERSKFGDFGTPSDATYKESVARQFYKELARRYHPDKGGTHEQMANLKLLEDQMLTMVEFNSGMGK
jgi:hypothetical protein